MKKVLFIINWMTKSNGKVGISWGDIRLFEVMKNMDQVEKHILTTTNWLSAMEKLGISCDEKTIINYEVNPWAFSNLWVSLISFFIVWELSAACLLHIGQSSRLSLR